MAFINLGFGNLVNAERVIAIVDPNTLPMKKLLAQSEGREPYFPATSGRKSRSAVVLDTGQILLSALQTETLAQRFVRDNNQNGEDD